MAKGKNNTPKRLLDQYDKVIATLPDQIRKGASMPYTSLNGHMFSFIDKNNELSLRLPEAERLKFLEDYETKLSVQHGRVMQEYAVVPKVVLDDLKLLSKYFKIGFKYTGSLKPKGKKKL